MLLKIIGVGVCTVIINIILKQYKPEIALLVNICGALLIFALAMSGINDIVNEFINLQNQGNIKIDIVAPIMKVIGVGYITEFTSDLAEDSGNKLIASKILLGGKIAICTLAFPIIKKLITAIFSLI